MECVVASRAPGGLIQFDWYTYSEEKLMLAPDQGSRKLRVFFGVHKRTERYPQAKAAASKPYSIFFTIAGNFKRHSVLREKPWSHSGAPRSSLDISR
jgi:hypothetical protein